MCHNSETKSLNIIKIIQYMTLKPSEANKKNYQNFPKIEITRNT